MNPEHVKLFEKLASLYEALDQESEHLRLRCKTCGECCHFEKQEHILYASQLEIDYFLWGVKNNNIETTKDMPVERCLFQEENVCNAHKFRPLGCRTFFCTDKNSFILEDLSNRFHGALKKIHIENNLEWQYKPFVAEIRKYFN